MKFRSAVPLLIVVIALQGVATPMAIASNPRAKPTPKITSVKKKVVVKKSTVKKPVRSSKRAVKPSPPPLWPPKGFTSVGTAYARVPTGKELIGILSALKKPNTAINACAADPNKPNAPAYSCAAILVGSSQRCKWWKITSTITGIDPANSHNRIPLGDITTLVSGASAKTIQTIFLISPVPLATGVKFTVLHALCGLGSTIGSIPSTSFIPTPTASPTPTPTDSPTPSDSPTPTNT